MNKNTTPVVVQLKDIPRSTGLSQDDLVALARHQANEQRQLNFPTYFWFSGEDNV